MAWEELVRWSFLHASSLLEEHLAGLTEDDIQYAPVDGMWTVHRGEDGLWRPDWDLEADDGPPARIGWVMWHIGWWWTEALAAWHGEPLLPREEVYWPGSAAAGVEWIRGLAERWRQEVLAVLPGGDLDRVAPFPWDNKPERTIGHLVFWVNGELMKNAAELGQLRMMRTTAS